MRPLLALLGFSAGALAAADWPQYRGPNRDDLSAETGLLKAWPKAGPPLLWIYDGAGVGYSPPAVVGDRVYVTGGREDHEFLIALDLKTTKDGAVKEAWAAKIGPTFRFPRNSWSAGPSAAPTVADGLIYALGGNEKAARLSGIRTERLAFLAFVNMGVLAALGSLLQLGERGMQVLLGRAIALTRQLRRRLSQRADVQIVNEPNVGPVTLFRVYPPGVDPRAAFHREQTDAAAGNEVERVNAFNHAIHQRSQRRAKAGAGIGIGWTRRACRAADGRPIAALKSYLLSPFLEPEMVAALVDELDVAERDEVEPPRDAL